MNRLFSMIIIFTVFSSWSMFASELTVATADHMLDIVGGKIVSPAVIVIEGNKIQAVNPREEPLDAKLVKVS